MDGASVSALGRILAAADGPTAGEHATTGQCGICGYALSTRKGDVVEVELESDDDGPPDAWLCHSCYEAVLGELELSPTRVFKSGPHRRVVLPVSPPRDPGQ